MNRGTLVSLRLPEVVTRVSHDERSPTVHVALTLAEALRKVQVWDDAGHLDGWMDQKLSGYFC